MSDDKIREGVCQCLAIVIKADAAKIKPEDRIIKDLGADSLDLLDLIFQLERHFGIRIKPRDIERRAKEALGDVPLERDGFYTEEALAQFRLSMPEVPPEELSGKLRTNKMPSLFRVRTFMNLVKRLMAEQKS